MAVQWIEARTALDVFGNRMTICERTHAGLIRSRAELFNRHDQELRDVELPREFWWAKGHEALEQNWDTGDFSTWIDRKLHWRGYGVRFALDDLLKLIPFEEHAATRRRLSVAGNPAWVSAREARRFAYDQAGVQPVKAGKAVVKQCRFGFISARAVEMRFARGSKPGDWTEEAREWDIPTWFWEDFTMQEASSQDWEQGSFSGRGRAPQGYGWMTLDGVYFLRPSLDVLLPVAPTLMLEQGRDHPPKPNLAEADLQTWWHKRAGVRDALSQNDLWVLAKADHPEHSIARDRIRALAEGRTPGPKHN